MMYEEDPQVRRVARDIDLIAWGAAVFCAATFVLILLSGAPHV